MFIEVIKNNGTDYLRLSSSKRITDKNGQKVARKHVELNIGPLSRFDDGQPDFLERLRESFRKGDPIIDVLKPYATQSQTPTQHTLTFSVGSDDCIGRTKYFSQCLLESFFTELGLTSLMATIKHQDKIEFDLQGLMRLLVFGRILNPASEIAAFSKNQDYSAPLSKDDDPFHIYDVLSILGEHKEKIIHRMNSSLTKGLGRNLRLAFYGLTKSFLETEGSADDYTDDHAPGKMPVTRENPKQPLVHMGLFLDDMGIPITLDVFPGHTLDQATLPPAIRSSMNNLGFSRFILVADGGTCSDIAISALQKAGDGYIVSKSTKKANQAERSWILDKHGYINRGDGFRYKSRQVTRTIKDENGQEQTINQQAVVYWSEVFFKREYSKHKGVLGFIEKLKKTPASFRVTAAQIKNLQRFFKKQVLHSEIGEFLDAGKLLSLIDEEKLQEFTAYMGYYQIVTSELEMAPLEVIDKYQGLTQIEDQFRMLKGDLESRPMFVRTPEHIEAHLLICMIALTFIRLIQKRLLDSSVFPERQAHLWTYGLSSQRIQRALQKWKVEAFPEEYYRFCDIDDPDLQLILAAYHIHLPTRLYTRGDLKNIKPQIIVFS